MNGCANPSPKKWPDWSLCTKCFAKSIQDNCDGSLKRPRWINIGTNLMSVFTIYIPCLYASPCILIVYMIMGMVFMMAVQALLHICLLFMHMAVMKFVWVQARWDLIRCCLKRILRINIYSERPCHARAEIILVGNWIRFRNGSKLMLLNVLSFLGCLDHFFSGCYRAQNTVETIVILTYTLPDLQFWLSPLNAKLP